MPLEVVRVEDTPEVRTQLRMLREVLGPVVGRLERVAVEVAADVDTRAGIAVLPPRATGATVLLDDRERQLRLRESERGEQPGLATADDDDVRVGAHVVGYLVGPRDRARVGTIEMQVFEEHRTTSSSSGTQARNAIISRMSSSEGAGGSTHPRSRNSRIAGSAHVCAAACSSSDMPPV